MDIILISATDDPHTTNGMIVEQISNDSYGIENMDAKYLAEDLIENEPKLFG